MAGKKKLIIAIAAVLVIVTAVIASGMIFKGSGANPIRTIVNAAERTGSENSCSFSFGSKFGSDADNYSGRVEFRPEENYFALELSQNGGGNSYIAFEKGYLKFYTPETDGSYTVTKASPRNSMIAALAIELFKNGFKPEDVVKTLEENPLLKEVIEGAANGGTGLSEQLPDEKDLEKAVRNMENALADHTTLRDVLGYEKIAGNGKTTYFFGPNLRSLEDTLEEAFLRGFEDKAFYQQLHDSAAVLRTNFESQAEWLFEQPFTVSFDISNKGYLTGASFDYIGEMELDTMGLYFSLDRIGQERVDLPEGRLNEA